MANDNGSAILMAFVLGAVAGAATALLWAPHTGEETRRLLADKAREGRDRANEVAQKGREFVDRQRDTLQTAIDRGKEAYQRTRATEEPA